MPRLSRLTSNRLVRTAVPLIVCVLTLAVVAPVALAQDSQGGAGAGMGGDSANSTGRNGDPGARMMTALFRGITLTDTQRKSADSVHAAYQWQIAKVNGTTPWIARRNLRQKEMGDLRAVLTSDQQPAFDRNLDAIRARMMAGGQRGGGQGPQ